MTLNDFIISYDADLRTALSYIDKNQKGFLVVVDEKGHLMGTLTDGDIRRGLLSQSEGTLNVNDKVEKYYRSQCVSIHVGEAFTKVINIFKKKGIKFIPIVDENNKVVNLITKANMHGVLLQNIQADLSYDFMSMDETLLDYEIFERPWGFYKTTILNDFYQSKVLEIHPKCSISLQEHRQREEHWIVVNGEGNVQIGESILPVHGGSSLFIPKGCRHRMTNTSATENLIIIEVQRGQYFGEDDIIRFDDEYGRV